MMKRHAKSGAFIENNRSNVPILNFHIIFSSAKQQKTNRRNRTKPSTDVFQINFLFTFSFRVILLVNNINLSFSHRYN